MINRRGVLFASAAAGASGVFLGSAVPWFASGARAASAFEEEIEALERRAADLGITQPSARLPEDSSGDAFSDNKERLLDLQDQSEGKGVSGRSVSDDAGDVLARMTAEEAQTPKGAKDLPFNSAAAHRAFGFNEQTRAEYRELFATCVLRGDRRVLIERDVKRALSDPRNGAYKEIESRTGVPWYFVAAIHDLEASFNLTRHLHNGDSLNERTAHVPRNRPKIWKPPTDWASSAVDALSYEGFTSKAAQQRGWGLEAMLYRFERYNGLGSRKRGINSPYLWSYSNHYSKGKYVADGVWDGEAVSRQCGAAVLIKAMIEKGAVAPPPLWQPTV